jgi:hypothetical protein
MSLEFKSSNHVFMGNLYALQLVLLHVIILEQHENVEIVFFFSNQQMKKLIFHICTSWIYDQIKGFMQKQLMGSYLENMFKQHIKLNFRTFEWLCQ